MDLSGAAELKSGIEKRRPEERETPGTRGKAGDVRWREGTGAGGRGGSGRGMRHRIHTALDFYVLCVCAFLVFINGVGMPQYIRYVALYISALRRDA